MCDREASKMKRPWPTRDCCSIKKKPKFKDFRENVNRMLDKRLQNCSHKEMEGIINKVSEKKVSKNTTTDGEQLTAKYVSVFYVCFVGSSDSVGYEPVSVGVSGIVTLVGV